MILSIVAIFSVGVLAGMLLMAYEKVEVKDRKKDMLIRRLRKELKCKNS